MNDLEFYFRNNNGRLIHKWHHYFDIYDRHFSRFRGHSPVVAEIGVAHGGSLQMWKHYFGPGSKIIGIDNDPRCKALEEEGIRILIGSQTDKDFLKQVIQTIPPFDILIDDGGHTMKQQITSFEELFGHIQTNGVYLCEDLHTSYWKEYGGGYKKKKTFIEYTKTWIDSLNAFHSRSKKLKVNDFTLNARSVHYYDSIVVVEKVKVTEPVASKTGHESF